MSIGFSGLTAVVLLVFATALTLVLWRYLKSREHPDRSETAMTSKPEVRPEDASIGGGSLLTAVGAGLGCIVIGGLFAFAAWWTFLWWVFRDLTRF